MSVEKIYADGSHDLSDLTEVSVFCKINGFKCEGSLIKIDILNYYIEVSK